MAEYLIDGNATQAAIRAGYSKRTAKQQGARLLTNVDLRAEIEAAQKKRSDETQIDAKYVLTRLKSEAEFKGDGSSHSARVRALEALGKHLGLFPNKVEHTGAVRLKIVREIVDGGTVGQPAGSGEASPPPPPAK